MSRDGNGNDNGMKKIQLIHDAASIYYLHPSESPSNSLSKYLLTGDKNYYTWVKAITNALEGRNKLGFITGEFAPPEDATTPEFSSWKSNNSIICSWLFNSVDASIQPSIASHKIAKTLWEDLAERYSITDGQRIHQLKSEYTLLRQKGLSVDAYYNKFKSLWYELRGLEDVTCACTCSAAPKIRAQAEQDKTYGFLMGLDDNQFGEIRTQILGMDPLPTLNRAFYIVMSKAMNLEDDNTESVDQENIPIEEVFEQLKCTREGLTSEEAAYRLELFGPNKLEEKKENKFLKFLGFIKRNNRVNLDPKCKVLRDKQWKVSEAAILVPGDIIRITMGDIVPADARLLEGDSILVDQSALTGESLPVTRVPGEEVFSGSICTQGETEAIVIATGVHTFFGNAAAHLVDTTNNVGHSKKG